MSIIILGVDVGTVFDQKFDCLKSALFNRLEKRSLPIIIFSIDISAFFNEKFNHLNFASLSRIEK